MGKNKPGLKLPNEQKKPGLKLPNSIENFLKLYYNICVMGM